jgi:hypothetical protein
MHHWARRESKIVSDTRNTKIERLTWKVLSKEMKVQTTRQESLRFLWEEVQCTSYWHRIRHWCVSSVRAVQCCRFMTLLVDWFWRIEGNQKQCWINWKRNMRSFPKNVFSGSFVSHHKSPELNRVWKTRRVSVSSKRFIFCPSISSVVVCSAFKEKNLVKDATRMKKAFSWETQSSLDRDHHSWDDSGSNTMNPHFHMKGSKEEKSIKFRLQYFEGNIWSFRFFFKETIEAFLVNHDSVGSDVSTENCESNIICVCDPSFFQTSISSFCCRLVSSLPSNPNVTWFCMDISDVLVYHPWRRQNKAGDKTDYWSD